MKTIVSKAYTVIIIWGLLLTACAQATENPPSGPEEIQVVSVNEGGNTKKEFTQTKVFDQCQSSGPLRADISFNEITIKEAGEELIIGGSLTGEVNVSPAASIALQGNIQKHYSEKSGQSLGHQESITIEVPANTKQQYSIIWAEHRQQGSVDYVENGDNKSIEYSYRTGVELASSSVQDLPCSSIPAPENDPFKLDESKITTSGETILFIEDFQDKQHSFYSLDGGNWSIGEDPYLPGNQIFQVDTTGTVDVSSATLLQTVPESFTLELKVRFTQDNQVDRYFVSTSWWKNRNYVISAIQQQVYFVNRDTVERFFEYNYKFAPNEWYTLRVEVNGNNANFYLNGLKVGEVENLPSDDTMLGELGFVVGENSGIVQFDDFYVIDTRQ